jgi:hypothetical protein
MAGDGTRGALLILFARLSGNLFHILGDFKKMLGDEIKGYGDAPEYGETNGNKNKINENDEYGRIGTKRHGETVSAGNAKAREWVKLRPE